MTATRKKTPTSTRNGTPLDIRMVNLNDIVTPIEYQRQLNQKKVDAMAADFKPEECGVIPVTDRGDGTFAATDGQHRIEMLRIVGIEEWPCQVMEPRPLAGEARVFVDLQTKRTALTGKDKWRARRVAKDPVVLDIEAVVDSLGLEIATDKKKSWRSIQATTALERIYLAMGEKHLHDTLRIAGLTWPEHPDAFKSPVLLGVASFLYYYRDDPTFRRDEVVNKWAAFPLKRIIQSASELNAAVSGGHGSNYSKSSGLSWAPGMVAALVGAYNYKRSTRQIEMPTLKGWKAIQKRAKAEAENRA